LRKREEKRSKTYMKNLKLEILLSSKILMLTPLFPSGFRPKIEFNVDKKKLSRPNKIKREIT